MENVKDDEDKAQRCLGPEDINIQTKGQESTCGFLYYEDRSTGTTLKQSTYQISRSFTTSACAIFMEQRNNNNNDPLWVMGTLPMVNRTKGQREKYQNESPKGPEGDGTESERVLSGVHGVVTEWIGDGWE